MRQEVTAVGSLWPNDLTSRSLQQSRGERMFHALLKSGEPSVIEKGTGVLVGGVEKHLK